MYAPLGKTWIVKIGLKIVNASRHEITTCKNAFHDFACHRKLHSQNVFDTEDVNEFNAIAKSNLFTQ